MGESLGARTEEVVKFRHPLLSLAYGDLVFVDTPGFESKSDLDVLKMVDNWLKSTYVFFFCGSSLTRLCVILSRYGKSIKLSGLLYFHRISDNRRKPDSPLKYLSMFERLCGKNTLQNVILTTTMWDEVDLETGEERERELKTGYWRPMLNRSSTTNRFSRTRESALTVIDPLIDTAIIRISDLILADMRKKLSSTSQATRQELLSTLEPLLRQRESLLRRIRDRKSVV